MSLSTLDPRPALVVVDLQKGIVGMPTAHPTADVVARSAELAAAFRRHGLPVVLVTVTGRAPGRTDAPVRARSLSPDAAEPAPELDPQPGDIRVSKATWGAFQGTDLDAQLREADVTQVVLTGVATSAGVESTARAAHEHGYHVVLVTDAMTDMDPENHRHSVKKIFPRIGETTTTAALLAALDARS